MLKRGSKSSYNPYSTSQRVKKAELKGKDRLDILPNKHNVWLKQVCSSVVFTWMLFCFLSNVHHSGSGEKVSVAYKVQDAT